MHVKDRDNAGTEEKASLKAESLQSNSTVLQRLDYKGCLFALRLNVNLNPKAEPKNF